MRNRNDNMLLRIAQGDAYGLAAEFVNRKEHGEFYDDVLLFKGYKQNPRYSKLAAGSYSDDTQMSIAVAEVLIDRGVNARIEDYADAFFDCFKRDPMDGYSRHFQSILEQSTSSTHMRSLIVPTSNRNGACMRAAPIGVLKKVSDVIACASNQASITHASWGGINSAVAVALMSHFALYDYRGFPSMYNWGSQQLQAFEHFREPWVGPVVENSMDKKGLGLGMNTAWAVHTLLVEEKSLMGILKRAIEWGGDTDSVCAIAWGIASARFKDEVLPEFMERDLVQNGNYGPTFLKQRGKLLMDTFK